MLTLTTSSAKETFHLGEILGRLLEPGDVICLQGELGAGKTCFVQGIARGQGVEDYVSSPSFTLINVYQGRLPFYHIDVYRLTDVAETVHLGLEEYLEDGGVVCLEWADRIQPILPPACLWVVMGKRGPTERSLRFEPHGARYRQLVADFKAAVEGRD